MLQLPQIFLRGGLVVESSVNLGKQSARGFARIGAANGVAQMLEAALPIAALMKEARSPNSAQGSGAARRAAR